MEPTQPKGPGPTTTTHTRAKACGSNAMQERVVQQNKDQTGTLSTDNNRFFFFALFGVLTMMAWKIEREQAVFARRFRGTKVSLFLFFFLLCIYHLSCRLWRFCKKLKEEKRCLATKTRQRDPIIFSVFFFFFFFLLSSWDSLLPGLQDIRKFVFFLVDSTCILLSFVVSCFMIWSVWLQELKFPTFNYFLDFFSSFQGLLMFWFFSQLV